MSDGSITGITREGFNLSAESSRERVAVTMVGNCDMQVTPDLQAVLTQLHAEVSVLRVRRVVFDCRQVYFMNSASIKCFVAWVMKMRPVEGFSVEFITNKNLGWQRRSLEAIQRFAPELVTLS